MSNTDPLPPVPGPYAPEEPLLTVGTITAAVTALTIAAIAFGLPISNDQQAALLGVVAVLAPIVVTAVARGKVWSPLSVYRAVQQAKRS